VGDASAKGFALASFLYPPVASLAFPCIYKITNMLQHPLKKKPKKKQRKHIDAMQW